jgi:hypothetical protein
MASSILIKEKVNKNEIEYARNVVSKELLKPKSMLMKTVEENILASKNVGNNVFEFSRTATSLIAVMVITYISSGILVWFRLDSFSFLLNFVCWSCFVLLFARVYVKYSGEYKEIGEYMDSLADILSRKVI